MIFHYSVIYYTIMKYKNPGVVRQHKIEDFFYFFMSIRRDLKYVIFKFVYRGHGAHR